MIDPQSQGNDPRRQRDRALRALWPEHWGKGALQEWL